MDTQVGLCTCLLHEFGVLLCQASGPPRPASDRPGFTCPLCGHRPWEAPESILADAGVELDGNYPNPIISLEKSENLVRLQTVLLPSFWWMRLLSFGHIQLCCAVVLHRPSWLLGACFAHCCPCAEGDQGSTQTYSLHLAGVTTCKQGQSACCRINPAKIFLGHQASHCLPCCHSGGPRLQRDRAESSLGSRRPQSALPPSQLCGAQQECSHT